MPPVDGRISSRVTRRLWRMLAHPAMQRGCTTRWHDLADCARHLGDSGLGRAFELHFRVHRSSGNPRVCFQGKPAWFVTGGAPRMMARGDSGRTRKRAQAAGPSRAADREDTKHEYGQKHLARPVGIVRRHDGGGRAGGRATAATEAQHPLHHGRRHRLDAAEHLPPRPDGRGNAQHRPHRQEGAMFMDYYAMQSCTSGRNAFFTGMYPVRTGMIVPQLPGSPSYLRPGTPAIAKFLLDLGYNTGEFGKNHLGDHTDVAADGAWLPGVLGLPLSPRCHAAGELPRHQQEPDRADASRRRAGTRRSPACPRCPVRWIPGPRSA